MNGIVWAKTKDFSTSSLRINTEPLLLSVPAIPSTPRTPERRERRGWVRVLSQQTWESLKNDQMNLGIQWCDSITCYLPGGLPTYSCHFISVNTYLVSCLVMYPLDDFISYPRHLVPCYAVPKKLGKYKWICPKHSILLALKFPDTR